MRRKLISTLLVATMVMAPVVSVSAATDDAAESTPVKAADAVGNTLPEKVEGYYTIGYAHSGWQLKMVFRKRSMNLVQMLNLLMLTLVVIRQS